MASYTVLTVFEGNDSINEPVIALPMMGKVSFRQIGFLMGLSVILPMGIYSGASDYILNILPEPIFSIDAVNTRIDVAWDVILALFPMPFGLVLGLSRPKLVPMDILAVMLVRFMIYRTSLGSAKSARTKKTKKKSRLAGFAEPYEMDSVPRRKSTYTVVVSELGIPKNITVTIYDAGGTPIRNRLARAYIDDSLQASITTDSDGTMGMTFVPHTEGEKSLRIIMDGESTPIVDATLAVQRSK